jgi:regulator of cell morphogenesis and NO signaling
MEDINTLTLGEIVKKNYKAAAVFERYSLDFCCKGNQNFMSACKANNIEPSLLINELNQLESEQEHGVVFDTWPLDMLIDYIIKRHHTYVEEKTPLIKSYLDKICEAHGARHPELHKVKGIFFEIGGELAVHMKKEELILFPFIKKLVQANSTKTPVTSPLFESVSNPVDMMKEDHAVEGERFRRLAALTNNYQIPSDACNTFAVAYQFLDEFEKDLHLHIHLENNILFPKAIHLEEELLRQTV